ncbi:MAG: serine hydrolase [Planctomycetales bacterium]|nr:serine hydrolase [Planctomycetales bacterium]
MVVIRVWLGMLLCGASVCAQATPEAGLAHAPVASRMSAPLEAAIRPLLEKHRGQVAVAVKHLTTGESFEHRADAEMPTASLIKLAVMVEAHRQADAGALDLSQRIELQRADMAPGSGILTKHFTPGMSLSVRDAIRLMIAYSDNTATNLVLDQIGLKSTSETMAKLGWPHTRIHAKVFRRDTSVDPERSRRFGLGSTTAAETIALLEKLQRHEFGEASSQAMLEHLLANEDDSQLRRGLPAGVKLAHKTGAVTRVRTDAGILYCSTGPVAVCVLTAENEDRRWAKDNVAEVLIGEVGRAVASHFHRDASAGDAGSERLSVGAGGQLVEDLQRTLNERLRPSPQLSVDGDFGPATKAAVERFQEQEKLAVDGVVSADVWRSLGTIVPAAAVPEPDQVNRQAPARSSADSLEGPPLVTAKAWAIADAKSGKSGELLWSAGANEARDIASTTKLMTALLVLELAARRSDVLEEEVEFSRRADETPGSSATLRRGERLPVRELLYGLLLPSGNDAAIAIAEHFGSRAGGDESTPADGPSDGPSDGARDGAADDSVLQFVAAMNERAKQLGMSRTTFRNPHGLTEPGHVSSAADLVLLARAALATPRFADYVNTAQRGCTVVGAGGYRRNLLWKNTNRLLTREGYRGMKTGTTSAAGACLVSIGQRDGDELIVVVLGSTSSDARYVDTRNLFRWAWRQRQSSPKADDRNMPR